MTTEKLEQSIVDKLKKLNSDKNEIIIKTGEIHLEIKTLSKILEILENEYQRVVTDMDNQLSELQQQYPSGEIDLNEGTITYQK